MVKADLHVHSTISDSSDSVETILAKAKEMGLTHIAFTEHDTTEHAEESVRMAEAMGIRAIKGIEISAYDNKKNRKAHILGFAYKTNDHLETLCAPTRAKRRVNCLKQMDVLRELGYQISNAAVDGIADGHLYKQHIYDYLVRSGQSPEMYGDIYCKIFKQGGPCDFDIEYVDVRAAVRAIKADGGFAILAHPNQQNNLDLVEELIPWGLDGVEVNHHANSPEYRERIMALGKKHNLIMTGGSDYHGRYAPRESVMGSDLAPESSLVMFSDV